MESHEDTANKVLLYKAQLEQVNQLLSIEPTNEQFLTLRNDLEKVITLTEALLSKYYEGASKDGVTVSHSQNIRKSSSNSNDDQYNLSDLEDENELNESTIKKSEVFNVGDRVEVNGGDRLYSGVIIEILSEKSFKVRYYEFDTVVTLPQNIISHIQPGPFSQSPQAVTVGMKCQCKYATDQKFYECIVNEITKYGINISYTAYGNSEEVPIDFLRPVVETQSASKQKDSKLVDSGGKPEIIPIPANLKILPTDTEEVSLSLSFSSIF
jgi:survival-of-motor-neuron-related-splicing factor 30